jgi:hypothetical protein
VDAAEVRERLALGSEHDERLRLLEAAPDAEVPRLTAAQAERLFPRLGIEREDGAALLELQPHGDAAWAWLLSRSTGALLAGLGEPEPYAPWPDLPAALGARGRLFASWVYLACLPATRRLHAEQDVPDDVSWATLADLGLHLAIHRRMHGAVGLDAPWWLQPHFRGAMFRLGRLQFGRHRAPLGSPPPAEVADVLPPGRAALGVHIPEDGRLDPEACDASFAAAARFFPDRFPDDAPVATCVSWLLDDRLAEHLPAESNIVRFQRRFTLLPGSDGDGDGRDGDRAIVFFVFRRTDLDPARLPRRTRLERVVAEHLAAGGHWAVRRGFVPLERNPPATRPSLRSGHGGPPRRG